MWIGDDVNAEVQRNAVLPMGVQIWDEVSNAPASLVGYTLSCDVALAKGEDAIPLAASVTMIDAVNGEFDLTFNGTQLTGVPGPKEAVNLAYEVMADAGAGIKLIIMRGVLRLLPGIN